MSDYDVIIVGAGMSGLAAGIRLAMFDRRVCIVEQHDQFGGLNSFYTRNGRLFDVGLHALTNYVPDGVRAAPLPKLLRQLRIPRDEWNLAPQRFSEIHFPDRRLRFGNEIGLLTEEIAREFPAQIDGFLRLVQAIHEYDDTRLNPPKQSTRVILADYLTDPVLTDMILCAVMYYGNPQPRDIDWTAFVILFKSIFLEGLCRPRGGVRTIIRSLVKRFRECRGVFRMGCAVQSFAVSDRRVQGVVLENGAVLTADVVLSSAGYPETMQLCHETSAQIEGRLSFFESIFVLNVQPSEHGHKAAIVFFNDNDRFTYDKPDDLIDPSSGVICCPNNFDETETIEGMIRLTSLADYDRWANLPPAKYASARQDCCQRALSRVIQAGLLPDIQPHVVFVDSFTPKTIRDFTRHINGAVYGSPDKHRDGKTPLENLFVIGTDQGYLGIVGSLLSGITIANLHVLSADL